MKIRSVFSKIATAWKVSRKNEGFYFRPSLKNHNFWRRFSSILWNMSSLNELKQSVNNHFKRSFGHNPNNIIIAPGRVNLVGEHIDYNGFGVVPCAIGRFTVIAVGSGKSF